MKRIFAVVAAILIQGRFVMAQTNQTKMNTPERNLEKATFAGGCFWCMQPVFDLQPGVVSTSVGYTGGTKANPTYEEVCSGTTGHVEALQVIFDPAKISYAQLLDVFWRNVDPTQSGGQFADVGHQYRTAIFYHTEEQKQIALASKKKMEQSGKYDRPIVTEFRPASVFYPAEEYHQKYYRKSPLRYKAYKAGLGREGYIKKTWGEPSGH